ncbi:hypothetical protein QF028_003067 [Neobacillus sp. B4I6]
MEYNSNMSRNQLLGKLMEDNKNLRKENAKLEVEYKRLTAILARLDRGRI